MSVLEVAMKITPELAFLYETRPKYSSYRKFYQKFSGKFPHLRVKNETWICKCV